MIRPVLLVAAVLTLTACTSSTSGHPSAGGSLSGTTTAPAGSTPAPTTSSPAPSARPKAVQPAPRSTLNGFRIADLTFVGNQGWALGTAGCVRTSGLCTALAHSTDAGRTWRSMTAPKVHVAVPDLGGASCTNPCVAHVRFATAKVGYLFGAAPFSTDNSTAFLMTTDGGRTWRRQPGGADALESLDGNVIRVTDPGNCPPGCRYSVELAPIGGTAWTSVKLPGSQGGGVGLQLVRTGPLAAVEVYGNPAGGAPAQAVLFTSRDDGAHWTRRGEPCPQGNREVDSSDLTSAPDGSISVLCTPRGGTSAQFTMASTDGGAHFRAGGRTALGAAGISAFGTASATTVLVSSDDTYRSTDGGRHFRRAPVSPGQLSWLGFASATVGHAVSVDRRSIWTSTDAGRTWTAAALR